MNLKYIFFFAAVAAFGLMGCDPYMEDSPGLPNKPTGNALWYFLPDTVDGVVGIDSNRIVVSAETSDDVFLHLWDFGNGKTSHAAQDTFTYFVEGTYDLTYQGHSAGGMVNFESSVSIEKTLELPCEGTLALLTGCDNPKVWKFSPEAGAIAIGPEPGSTEWYSAPEGWQTPAPPGNIDFQTDDRWTFTKTGQFIYDNAGLTMFPFNKGYYEYGMSVDTSTYTLELGSGINNEDEFTINGLVATNDLGATADICGWMGVWDSGPTYSIVDITEDRLVLRALQQFKDGPAGAIDPFGNTPCINPLGSGYFTLIFVTE